MTLEQNKQTPMFNKGLQGNYFICQNKLPLESDIQGCGH